MPARFTAYLPEQPAQTRLLKDGDVLQVGRGEDCGLRLDHPSISRRHAEFRQEHDGNWGLRDLDSKNGCHVAGVAVTRSPLTGNAWLRLGDVYCEFELLDAAGSAAAELRLQVRRTRATALTVGLQHASGFSALLDGSLRAVIELAQCERGFLLLRDREGEEDGFSIRARHAIEPDQVCGAGFSGSAGAVKRTLRDGATVVANDIGHDAWLSTRASVIAGGLRALVCLPLREDERTLGAIYADRSSPGAPITSLDLELLEAFAERAALYIAARRASDVLAAAAAPRWSPLVAGPAAP